MVKRIILKLVQQAMGCKVEWSGGELKLMREYIESKKV